MILIGFFAVVNVLVWSEVAYGTETLHLWVGRRNPVPPGAGTDQRGRDSPHSGEPECRSATSAWSGERARMLALRWG